MDKNKSSAARYAVIGLVIAALGCVATGLLAVVQGAVALKLFTPKTPQQIVQYIGISAAVLVLGLAIYAILNPDAVRRFLTGRQAHYGSNAIIMAIAFVGILGVVNWLAYKNPTKLADATEDKRHTLAPETVRTLATLPEKVTAIAFYSTQTPKDTAQQLLNDFKAESKGKFDFQFVDPNSNPVQAKQYGITSDGQIVLTMGGKKETASFAGEQELDQAMIRLINPEARTVYFLTGHGEPDINGGETSSLSRAKQTLESKNYTVKSLSLGATNKVPDDAKAIIIAGPQNPLLPQEVSLLKAYVAKGGSLIVMEDPTPFTKFGTNPDPLADYLKTDWGITLNNDVVVDLTSQQPLNAIAASYSTSNPITQHTTTYTIMPQSRSVDAAQNAPTGVTLSPLILTSQNSWGETDLAALQEKQQIGFDQGKDVPGPVSLAVAGENSQTKGRVVVFGNSAFATDKGFDAYANGDVFVNSVDWAAQQANLINLTPKNPINRTFNPPGQLQLIAILLGTVIVIPGLIVAAGLSNWLARRRRG